MNREKIYRIYNTLWRVYVARAIFRDRASAEHRLQLIRESFPPIAQHVIIRELDRPIS